MMSAVLIILVLASGAGLLGWKGQRQRRPAPRANAKRRSWRLVLPRAAGFSLAQATAWFTALAPLLTTDEPEPWMEWRSGGREVELRLGAPAAWEPTLRGQLAAWFPEARLEAVPEPESAGGVAVLPLR